MKLARFFAVILLVCICASCGKKERCLFSSDIEATVVYTVGKTEYRVHYLRVGDTERLEVLEPERLRGLKAEKSREKLTVGYSDLEFESGLYGMFEPFALLSPITVRAVSENVYCSENDVTVTFFGEKPIKVSGNNCTLEIVDFSERSERQ